MTPNVCVTMAKQYTRDIIIREFNLANIFSIYKLRK